MRIASEFDRAAGIYESIIAEFPTEAEAYWGLYLCKYGIEYVDDPKTAEKIITCHRTSFESIFNDSNFNQVLFYLECLWILYAMIEDRTSSFLYYLGFTSEKKRSSATGTRKIKNEIREILKMEQSNAKYKFDTLLGKLTRIKELLAWCNEEHEISTDYQKALVKTLKPVAALPDFEIALNYLELEWRDKRNQLTHALFNKNPDAVLTELLPLVEKGYKAARQLDAAIREIKKAKIRLKFKIQ